MKKLFFKVYLFFLELRKRFLISSLTYDRMSFDLWFTLNDVDTKISKIKRS